MSTRLSLLACVSVFALLTLTGCPSDQDASTNVAADSASSSAEPSAADLETAKTIFSNRCAVCHGATGAGDGTASAGLDPKPRNFTDPTWQASVTDEYIEKIVKYGGAAVGKSTAMPSNPDLSGKAGVLSALRIHVRSLKAK